MTIGEAIDAFIDIGGKIIMVDTNEWEMQYGSIYEYVNCEQELIKEVKKFLWFERVKKAMLS